MSDVTVDQGGLSDRTVAAGRAVLLGNTRGWKVMLPISLVNILLTGFMIYQGWF